MITAVDTNVLLDVLGADPRFGPHSRDALRACMMEGTLLACNVVWAELAASTSAHAKLASALKRLGVEFSPLDAAAAEAAGLAWRRFANRGARRGRVVADFLIGAHASHRADRLLTRNRGFYRAYFRGLRLVNPAGA